MREVSSDSITKTVKALVIQANKILPEDLVHCISCCEKTEQKDTARAVLSDLQANIDAAAQLDIPVCQDTGMAVIFAEIGQDVHISGENFEDAVNRGVAEGYTDGLLRKSVVRDPFFDRVNTNDNTPAVLHTRIVPGDKIRITAAPKGFGSENMSALRMFTPSAKQEDIIGFVVDTVKKAVCRSVSKRNPNVLYAGMEKEMLNQINALNIGPQGFGGQTTALAVNIETYPTHIAGLPVAVNIGCHVTRHASAEI